ncbi:MAG: hypothetical protein ACR2K6_05720 [Solirubrobacterales bacterium]
MSGGMGYSVGFVRGFLSLGAMVAAIALIGAAANELFDLGWAEDGYPGIGADRARGVGFASFALQVAILLLASGGLSVYLERYERSGPGAE